MSVREVICQTGRQVLAGRGNQAAWTDDQSLFAGGIGLDSLDFATLVVRLEQELGYDPFRSGDQERLPRTLGELISIYERRVGGR
jgi:hypothetical protein